MYQITYVLLKASNSPRPAAWILEKSLDGIVFIPWQFFATSGDDCMNRFHKPGQGEVDYVFKNDTEVICSTQYSKMTPLENGEIQFSLISGRPGATTLSMELLKFTLARYVRFRLVGMHTTTPGIKWSVPANELLKRSFYSFRHIVIGGRCVCNGHANKCKIDDNDTESVSRLLLKTFKKN